MLLEAGRPNFVVPQAALEVPASTGREALGAVSSGPVRALACLLCLNALCWRAWGEITPQFWRCEQGN